LLNSSIHQRAFDRQRPNRAHLSIVCSTRACVTTPHRERQWAYVNLEAAQSGPFRRRRAEWITSYSGYAGGTPPATASASSSRPQGVCYSSADPDHDYRELGFCEVVRVLLDAEPVLSARRTSGNTTAGGVGQWAHEQMRALADDYFASFDGPDGHRRRPDDRYEHGSPYRSVIGLPGGIDSPLFADVVAANAPFGMLLLPGNSPNGTEELNVVRILNTSDFPFYIGEMYHQYHLNFFQSEGMPYPMNYTEGLWTHMVGRGLVVSNGCPEEGSRG